MIGIEARVFDDLADLETEHVPYRTQSPTRLANWGFEDFGQKFVQLGNSVPKSPPRI